MPHGTGRPGLRSLAAASLASRRAPALPPWKDGPFAFMVICTAAAGHALGGGAQPWKAAHPARKRSTAPISRDQAWSAPRSLEIEGHTEKACASSAASHASEVQIS